MTADGVVIGSIYLPSFESTLFLGLAIVGVFLQLYHWIRPAYVVIDISTRKRMEKVQTWKLIRHRKELRFEVLLGSVGLYEGVLTLNEEETLRFWNDGAEYLEELYRRLQEKDPELIKRLTCIK